MERYAVPALVVAAVMGVVVALSGAGATTSLVATQTRPQVMQGTRTAAWPTSVRNPSYAARVQAVAPQSASVESELDWVPQPPVGMVSPVLTIVAGVSMMIAAGAAFLVRQFSQRPVAMAAMSSEVPRRTALLGSVAMAGLASAPPSMAFGGPDLFDKINAAIQPKVVDGSLGISFDDILRLVYHDTITYSRETNTGGLNGSIRFPEELARPENVGLAPVVDKLTSLQKDVQAATGLPISFTDVMVLTCQLIAARDFKINLCSKTDEASCETLYNGFGNKPKKLRVGRVDAKKPEAVDRPIPWIGTSGTDIIQTNALIGLTIPETLSIANGILLSEAQTIEVLATDPRSEKPIKDLENAKTSTTRTNYEVKFFQTLTKLSNISVFNEDQYKL